LIDGLVITFIDIDRIKRAQVEAERRQRDADAVLDSLSHPVVVLSEALLIEAANRAYYELVRSTAKLELGEPFDGVGDGRWNIPDLLAKLRSIASGQSTQFDCVVRRDLARSGQRELRVRMRAIRSLGEQRVLVEWSDAQNGLAPGADLSSVQNPST
jgi:two-component system CheB/CheR fusion protein